MVLIIDGSAGTLISKITTPNSIVMYPGISIYEMNSASRDAILLYVATAYRISCYNVSGAQIWSTDISLWSFRIGVVNIDSVCPKVIVYPYFGGNIYVLDGLNGSLMEIIRVGRDFGYAVFGDINDDGVVDIIAGERDKYLDAIDGKTFGVLWKINTYYSLMFPHVLYYEKNSPRVLVASYLWYEIKILNGTDGVVVKTLSLPKSARISTPPVVADINADGVFDVVVGSRDYKVYAISTDGTFLWSSDTYGIPTNIITGDMNNDCYLDVIAVDDYGYIYIFDGKNGSLLGTYYVGSSLSVCPAVGDIDGDGLNELVVSTDMGIYMPLIYLRVVIGLIGVPFKAQLWAMGMFYS